MQHDQESRTVSLLQDQVRKLQERLEFIEDSKIFQDPDSPSCFGSAHVPHQALITSSCKKAGRESRMQRSTREDISIPGNVFDCQLARRVLEELQHNSRNLATPSGIQRREGIEKSVSEEPLQSIPLPCFSVRSREKSPDDRNCLMSMTNHAVGIGTCTQSVMTIPSYPSSEMHLGNFPDHPEFQSWIVNFRPKVCSKAKNPTRALQWIKEIEAAKSLGDHITPKSITGKDFPDYEELDLMMASALERCYDNQTHFRQKISVEEQRAQKDNRFLRGRQIAHLIYEYFRLLDQMIEIQGLSGLFSIKLENDDTQDFDLRWEQALLLISDPPSDKVLEGLYVSKLQDSSQAHTIMALLNQEILRGGGKRDYHRLRMCVKLHTEQAQRSKKFQDSERDYRAWCRDKWKGAEFLLQAEDRRMLSVQGKWILFKRRIL